MEFLLDFFAGLGHGTVQTVYSYLGYYNVCNLGGEMKQPQRNIPRAIFISIGVIALLYFVMQTSILGVVPWQEAARTKAVVSIFVARTFGPRLGHVRHGADPDHRFRLDFLRHAGILARPLRGGARRQLFLRIFARPPDQAFPHVSLVALGATAVVFCLSLSSVDTIRAILAMRCLIQFIGQAVGLLILHRHWGRERLPFRMWFFPVPLVIAIVGWIGIFISTGRRPMLASLAAMTVGIVVYLGRARVSPRVAVPGGR